jgi:hypothetical protein
VTPAPPPDTLTLQLKHCYHPALWIALWVASCNHSVDHITDEALLSKGLGECVFAPLEDTHTPALAVLPLQEDLVLLYVIHHLLLHTTHSQNAMNYIAVQCSTVFEVHRPKQPHLRSPTSCR